MWTHCPSCEEQLFNKQLDKAMQRVPVVRPPLPPLGAGAPRPAPRRGHLRGARRGPRVRGPAGLRGPEGVPGPRRRGAGRDRPPRRRDLGLPAGSRAGASRSSSWTSGSWAARWAPWSARRSPGPPRARSPSGSRWSSCRPRAGPGCRRARSRSCSSRRRWPRSSACARRGSPYISVMTDPTTGGVFASLRRDGRRQPRRAQRADRLRRRARRRRHDRRRSCRPGSSAPSSCSATASWTASCRAPTCAASSPSSSASSPRTVEAAPWLTASSTAAGTREPRRRDRAARRRRAPGRPQGRDLGARPAGPQPAPPADARVRSRSWPTSSSSSTATACSATTRRSSPGFARIGDHRVVVVGQQKGADTEENVRRNFGMPHPEGYRKAMRVMELAERFGLPVVTFVDVPGRPPGPRVRGARHRRGHRPLRRPDDPPAHADRDRHHRRGRLGRGARDRRRRRRARARERRLRRDQPRGLREHPVADDRRGRHGGARDEDERPGPAGAGGHRRGDRGAARRAPTPNPTRPAAA